MGEEHSQRTNEIKKFKTEVMNYMMSEHFKEEIDSNVKFDMCVRLACDISKQLNSDYTDRLRQYTNADREKYTNLYNPAFGISELRGKYRLRPYADARHIYCYLMRKHFDTSLWDISKHINRDHATACHAFKKIKSLMTIDSNLKHLVWRAENQLKDYFVNHA